MAESLVMRILSAVVIAAGILSACTSTPAPEPANATPAAPSTPTPIEIPIGRDRTSGDVKLAVVSGKADLDEVVQTGLLRVLVPRSQTHFDQVNRLQHGRTVDAAAAFEAFINDRIKPRHVAVELIVTPEDELITALLAGKGEMAANLLLTFERDDQVAFATPVRSGIKELVVTGPKEPPLVSLEDVGGRTIHVRKASDHHASLVRLNEQLRKINRRPARIVIAAASQTDEDLLALVNAGRIPATLADDYVFDLWKTSLNKIAANRDVAVSQDGILAWVTRKDSPKLLMLANDFFSTHRLRF